MGPVIVLDKSVFQSLKWDEHYRLDGCFLENLTPILGRELLGDLVKEGRGSQTAEQIVSGLARKFGGSGPATNIDYRTLCLQSLMGNHTPLNGFIVPQAQSTVRGRMGQGMIIDLSPLNQAILRWSGGEFDQFDREFAGYWRETTRSLDFDSFVRQLDERHIVLPQANSLEELSVEVTAQLANPRLQHVWLRWMLDQLEPSSVENRAIRARWKSVGGMGFERYSPISWHCMRVLLLLVAATRQELVRWNPTNLVDIQYLYYAPFCMVFSSDDRLHQQLAPLVLRDDQSFVSGSVLKADLRGLIDWHESLSEHERRFSEFALGGYPPPEVAPTIFAVWQKHMRPWGPGMGNQAVSLTDEEKAAAIAWASALFAAEPQAAGPDV